jgi:hypothetical protein
MYNNIIKTDGWFVGMQVLLKTLVKGIVWFNSHPKYVHYEEPVKYFQELFQIFRSSKHKLFYRFELLDVKR